MVSKNAEFYADFKSVEKVEKNLPKNVSSKKMTEICTFPLLTNVRQTCFAYNFFRCIFIKAVA